MSPQKCPLLPAAGCEDLTGPDGAPQPPGVVALTFEYKIETGAKNSAKMNNIFMQHVFNQKKCQKKSIMNKISKLN